jgi:hypothetical protein
MISCIPVSTFICNEGYGCGPRPSYEQQKQQQQQQQYTVEQEVIQGCQFFRLVIKGLRNKNKVILGNYKQYTVLLNIQIINGVCNEGETLKWKKTGRLQKQLRKVHHASLKL